MDSDSSEFYVRLMRHQIATVEIVTTMGFVLLLMQPNFSGFAFTRRKTVYDEYGILNNITRGIILVLADFTLIHSILLRGNVIATHLKWKEVLKF